MTQKTEKLINRLCKIIDENKYLIIEGGLAVGKTFIAKKVVENLKNSIYCNQRNLPTGYASYDVNSEIVSVHPSYSYEDFVTGISMVTNGGINFQYQDKVFLIMIKKAIDSWKKQDNKKYVMIIDDIQRGYITGILGDVLSLIEPHGNSRYSVKIKDGDVITLPPNFYIIATRNNVVTGYNDVEQTLARRFFHYSIVSDYKYIDDNAVSTTAASTDVSANAIYYRVKRIVEDHMVYKYRISELGKEKYILGHGIFQEKNIIFRTKYLVIPMLEQYVKEGILEKTAVTDIGILKKLVESNFSKDPSFCEDTSIIVKVKDVTPSFFLTNSGTHKPFLSLLSRIKEQKLLCDKDVIDSIMFNPNVLERKKATFNKNEFTFSNPAYLFVKKSRLTDYYYGTTKSTRMLYSRSDTIFVNGEEYAVAAEMQPKEYNRWSEDVLADDYVNEKNSTSPNTILLLLLKNYYKRIISNYEEYLQEWSTDDNVNLLLMFAKEEWESFVETNRNIIPASGQANDNAAANEQVRNAIADLKLLWADIGDILSWGGQQIKVEGVYKVSASQKYQEYIDTMEKLNIHQMIMQGPPGTSKTYSTRGMLKYLGKEDGKSDLNDAELDNFQIVDYENSQEICEWSKNNAGNAPKIAWDIVQFHPSYGYEDFVRGIEVSTVKNNGTGTGSSISYDTVDKILGKMAVTAKKTEFKGTKFYLIIDEINRANLATVFGELIYGLEYRGEGVATPYTVDKSNKIVLPDNLYIVGTMNTADKSIGGIDYAIRRRFLFFSLLPEQEAIEKFGVLESMTDAEKVAQVEVNSKALKLFLSVSKLFDNDNLNSEYFREDVQIGHTYFLVSSEEQLYLRFRYQILPILREYQKDGMFQFEAVVGQDTGFDGLLNCVVGNINVNKDETLIKNIFDSIIG